MRARYHLRFGTRPLCDHMGCLVGIAMCRDAEVTSCSYRTIKDARAAMRRLNNLPGWAGSTRIAKGECPRETDIGRREPPVSATIRNGRMGF
jgi:hypothetical protein